MTFEPENLTDQKITTTMDVSNVTYNNITMEKTSIVDLSDPVINEAVFTYLFAINFIAWAAVIYDKMNILNHWVGDLRPI